MTRMLIGFILGVSVAFGGGAWANGRDLNGPVNPFMGHNGQPSQMDQFLAQQYLQQQMMPHHRAMPMYPCQ